MTGQQREDLNDCEVGDFVLVSEEEVNITEYWDVQDEKGMIWIQYPDGMRRFVTDEVEGKEGWHRIERINDPAPGEESSGPVAL